MVKNKRKLSYGSKIEKYNSIPYIAFLSCINWVHNSNRLLASKVSNDERWSQHEFSLLLFSDAPSNMENPSVTSSGEALFV